MSTPTLKLASLAIRTLAKPIATHIKTQARDHARFRNVCIAIAQNIHKVDIRLRLGLLRDTTKNLAAHDAAEKARKHADALKKLKEGEAIYPAASAQVRSDLLAPEVVAQEEEKKKNLEERRAAEKAAGPRIRPLSETKAIDAGANFISEAFLFAIAAGLILFESIRSRRKESKRKDVVKERLELLEERNKQDEERLEELERRDRRHEELLMRLEDELWKLSGGKGERKKHDKEKFREWEKKPLWTEKKKGKETIWQKTWDFVTGGSPDEVEEAEIKLEKVPAEKK